MAARPGEDSESCEEEGDAAETDGKEKKKDRIFFLKTCDGERLKVKESILVKMQLLENMLQDLGCEENDEIPLPETRLETLGRVVDFYRHVSPDTHFLDKDTPNPELFGEWFYEAPTKDEAAYLRKFTTRQLWDFAGELEYLVPNYLLRVVQKACGQSIRGMTPDQIRSLLGLKDDLTEEDWHCSEQLSRIEQPVSAVPAEGGAQEGTGEKRVRVEEGDSDGAGAAE